MAAATKKKPAWITSMARQLIAQDMIDGIVSCEEPIKDTKKLYDELYAGNTYFSDFPYVHERFSGKQGRFASMQKQVLKLRAGATKDAAAFEHDMKAMRKKGPPTTLHKSGEPLWRNSEADHWLDVDMLAEKHLGMDPMDLRATRECYKEFSPDRFRKRIDQKKHMAKPFSETPGQTRTKKDKRKLRNNKDMSRRRVVDRFVNESQRDCELEYDDDESETSEVHVL